jgi:hypothetical protein
MPHNAVSVSCALVKSNYAALLRRPAALNELCATLWIGDLNGGDEGNTGTYLRSLDDGGPNQHGVKEQHHSRSEVGAHRIRHSIGSLGCHLDPQNKMPVLKPRPYVNEVFIRHDRGWVNEEDGVIQLHAGSSFPVPLIRQSELDQRPFPSPSTASSGPLENALRHEQARPLQGDPARSLPHNGDLVVHCSLRRGEVQGHVKCSGVQPREAPVLSNC